MVSRFWCTALEFVGRLQEWMGLVSRERKQFVSRTQLLALIPALYYLMQLVLDSSQGWIGIFEVPEMISTSGLRVARNADSESRVTLKCAPTSLLFKNQCTLKSILSPG
jgi:hypothetical protein